MDLSILEAGLVRFLLTDPSATGHGDPTDISRNAVCKLAEVSIPSYYREFGCEDGLTLAAPEDYADSVLVGVSIILDGNTEFTPTPLNSD